MARSTSGPILPASYRYTCAW